MIIDYIEHFEISDQEVARHLNELRSLEYLATGSNHLNVAVQGKCPFKRPA